MPSDPPCPAIIYHIPYIIYRITYLYHFYFLFNVILIDFSNSWLEIGRTGRGMAGSNGTGLGGSTGQVCGAGSCLHTPAPPRNIGIPGEPEVKCRYYPSF